MARPWAPEDRSQADWPTVACQVEAEELFVTHAPEVPADVARTIIRELVAAGRVPPQVPDAHDTLAISVVRCLWIGTHPGPSGLHLVVIIGDQAVISRAQAAPDIPTARLQRGDRRPMEPA
jgi:hypothetical protein